MDKDYDRFLSKIIISGDCWNWLGSIDQYGYSQFWHKGKTVGAHRYSYTYKYGTIPDGLQLDHLCRNRQCVNPDHLEAVTPKENVQRSNSPSVIISRTGICKRGHKLTPENTILKKNHIRCRICQNISGMKSYKKYMHLHKDKKRQYDILYRQRVKDKNAQPALD